MVGLLILLLLGCVAGVFHTYLIYPRMVRAAARRCRVNTKAEPGSVWPEVHLLMAVHNEEAILPRKLATILDQDYPGPLHLHIGSDNSSDRTNAILRDFAETSALPVNLQLYASRQGKPEIINQLATGIPSEAILLLTDASVLLRNNTVSELVQPLRDDPGLGLTDSWLSHTHVQSAGIAAVEDSYIRSEVSLKLAESSRFGRMIGPFGGCWAIRAAAFRPVPPTFLVDDFYLCMAAYADGWRGRTVATAVVTEDVGQHMLGEFRRKVRIGAGNWQNLTEFRKLWWPCWKNELAFAFFSHKVLRWITPLLLLLGVAAWLSLIGLTGNYWLGLLFAALTGSGLLLVLAERSLSVFDIHCTRVRALTYFTAMNLALLLGLLRYLNGIRTNVWQPTDRPRNDGP